MDIEDNSVSLHDEALYGVNEAYKEKCGLSTYSALERVPHTTNRTFLPVNQCFQSEIGFGRYQIELFMLSGFGWLADSETVCFIMDLIASNTWLARPLATRRSSYTAPSPRGSEPFPRRVHHPCFIRWSHYRCYYVGKSIGHYRTEIVMADHPVHSRKSTLILWH